MKSSALGSITMKNTSRGDGILAELFQILKDDDVKVLNSVCQNIWKTQEWPQDWERSVFIPIPKKGNDKECSKYWMMHLFYMLARLCTISFKLGFSSMWMKNFQMYKLSFKEAEKSEFKLPTFFGS